MADVSARCLKIQVIRNHSLRPCLYLDHFVYNTLKMKFVKLWRVGFKIMSAQFGCFALNFETDATTKRAFLA